VTHTIPIWNACPATSCCSDLLSALAGLSTTISSLLGLSVRKPGPRFMTLTLGFSAGAMILVSFVGLLPGGIDAHGTVRLALVS